MESIVHPARRFFVRTWPLLLALALLIGMPAALSAERHGRVAVKASIILPDMIVQSRVTHVPVRLITDAPTVERVTIRYESRDGPRSIEADLYIPPHGENRVGVVFSMGAPPLDLDDPRLVRIAEDSARAGAVMLVPFSERLDERRILPEEIDALVAQFKFVQDLPQVDPERVGFFGASVGGSLALVAAADPRIADDVDHVVSFGGYYDALETFGAVLTQHISYDGVDEEWIPDRHAERVVTRQLIYMTEDSRDREILTQVFLERRQKTEAELATLSPVGKNSYDFLANRDPGAVRALIERLPQEGRERMAYMSPSTSIRDVKAEVFIVHDRADRYIPYTEVRRMRDDVGHLPNIKLDELRLFEHVEPRLTQGPDVIAVDSTRLLFRTYQLLLRWER
jgi:acetyl esterase/lipase